MGNGNGIDQAVDEVTRATQAMEQRLAGQLKTKLVVLLGIQTDCMLFCCFIIVSVVAN
jgi:hypothetical protein